MLVRYNPPGVSQPSPVHLAGSLVRFLLLICLTQYLL